MKILAKLDQNFEHWSNVFRLRQRLETLGNKEVLSLIDSSLFSLHVDMDWSHSQSDLGTANKNTVAGPDPTNRWFDKSIR